MNDLFIQKIMVNWDCISPDSYLKKIEVINQIEEISLEKPITYFVGENGSGKSTLLEAIAISYGFNPEGGSRNYNFHTYDSHSELCNAVTLGKGWRKLFSSGRELL